MPIVLYSYYRSSAAYRVRIALNLKNIDYEIREIHLLKDGGEQHQADYLQLNPQGLVPALVTGNSVLIQSSAIIEYLEEVYPHYRLLPDNPADRAYVRSLAQIIGCDIHPLNNLRVLNYLKIRVGSDKENLKWYRHWIEEGFNAFEQLLQANHSAGRFCFGSSPGLADIFLIPQVYNARRFQCDLTLFPLISKIVDNCLLWEAFANAAPDNQTNGADGTLAANKKENTV